MKTKKAPPKIFEVTIKFDLKVPSDWKPDGGKSEWKQYLRRYIESTQFGISKEDTINYCYPKCLNIQIQEIE